MRWLPVNGSTFRHASNAECVNVAVCVTGTFDEHYVVLTSIGCE